MEHECVTVYSKQSASMDFSEIIYIEQTLLKSFRGFYAKSLPLSLLDFISLDILSILLQKCESKARSLEFLNLSKLELEVLTSELISLSDLRECVNMEVKKRKSFGNNATTAAIRAIKLSYYFDQDSDFINKSAMKLFELYFIC